MAPYVVHSSSGLEIRPRQPGDAPPHELGHRFVGVVEVAEEPRGRGTHLDARRRPQLAVSLASVVAEGAFINCVNPKRPFVRYRRLKEDAYILHIYY